MMAPNGYSHDSPCHAKPGFESRHEPASRRPPAMNVFNGHDSGWVRTSRSRRNWEYRSVRRVATRTELTSQGAARRYGLRSNAPREGIAVLGFQLRGREPTAPRSQEQ